MKRQNHWMLAVVTALVVCAAGVAQTEEAEPVKEQPKAPSWESLTETSRDLAVSRHTPEAIEAQIDAKKQHLASLRDQRAALEADTAMVLNATKSSLNEIDSIDDPVLRDESLLRFRAAKDVRLQTIQATLAKVNETIEREQKELDALNRMHQSRVAEARLYGNIVPAADSTYLSYLSERAENVRASEREMLRQLRERQFARLKTLVMPKVAVRVPDPVSAVLASQMY